MRLSAKFLKLTWIKVVDDIANIHKDLKAGEPSIASKLKLLHFVSERDRKKTNGLYNDSLASSVLKTKTNLSLKEIRSVLDSLVRQDKHYHYALCHFPTLLRIFIVKLVSLEDK